MPQRVTALLTHIGRDHPMPQRVTALLTHIGREGVERLSPLDRQLLGDQCQRVLDLCRRAQVEMVVEDARQATRPALRPKPKSGVLLCLDRGERSL